MIVSLNDDERVAADILRGHVPGQVREAVPSADSQTAALPERVEGESLVGAETLTRRGFDGSGGHREEAGQERPKRPLTDKADAGAVRLVEYREPRAPRAFAHRALLELAERHQRARQLRARHGVEEIALVLGAVTSLVEGATLRGALEARIVSGREMGGAEPARPFQRRAELDLAIAQHVGIRRAPGAMLAQKLAEHLLAVLSGEARPVQRNAELGCDRARVLIVLGGGAVAVVVLLPVAHEEALHLPARILQEQRGDRGVDAPGQPDDDAIAHRLTALAPAAPAVLRSSAATGSAGAARP